MLETKQFYKYCSAIKMTSLYNIRDNMRILTSPKVTVINNIENSSDVHSRFGFDAPDNNSILFPTKFWTAVRR